MAIGTDWDPYFQVHKEFLAGDIDRAAATDRLLTMGFDDFGAGLEIDSWEWHGSAQIPPKPRRGLWFWK